MSRSATGTTGSFDIAALFIVRCEQLYLTPGEPGEHLPGRAAGWIVNRASLTADNWSRFRDARQQATTLDLSRMRPQPFSGAQSAVWFTGVSASGERKALTVARGETVRQEDPWELVRGKIVEIDADTAAFPVEASGYATGEAGGRPRAGANLRPHCLVVADSVDRSSATAPGMAAVTTRPSRQPPWKNAGVLTGDVPEAWLTDAVFSQNLLVGCFTAELTTCVIPPPTVPAAPSDTLPPTSGTPTAVDPPPASSTPTAVDPPPASSSRFRRQAETVYTSFKSRGSTTPRTLTGMLDYQGRLSAQLADASAWTVVYNKSGQYLRAARTRQPVIVNDACYRMPARNTSEAAYLVAVLNADALQDAFRAVRRSDRHYDTSFWHSVPIPHHNSDDGLHQRLARLGGTLERAAAAARDRPGIAEAKQPKASELIREALRSDGLAQRLDEAVGELLPAHAATPSTSS